MIMTLEENMRTCIISLQDKSSCRLSIQTFPVKKNALVTVYVDHKRRKTSRTVHHSRRQDAYEAILMPSHRKRPFD